MGQRAVVRSPNDARLQGTFAFSDSDPTGFGDDGGTVLKAPNGWWVRQFAHSKTEPILWAWFESIHEGADITALLSRWAKTYAPVLYMRAPDYDLHVTCDYVRFDNFSEFRLEEGDGLLTIQRTRAFDDKGNAVSGRAEDIPAGALWTKISGDIWRLNSPKRVWQLWGPRPDGKSLENYGDTCHVEPGQNSHYWLQFNKSKRAGQGTYWTWDNGALYVRMYTGVNPRAASWQLAFDDMTQLFVFWCCDKIYIGGPNRAITIRGAGRWYDPRVSIPTKIDRAVYDGRMTAKQNTADGNTNATIATDGPPRARFTSLELLCNLRRPFYSNIWLYILSGGYYERVVLGGSWRLNAMVGSGAETVILDELSIDDPTGVAIYDYDGSGEKKLYAEDGKDIHNRGKCAQIYDGDSQTVGRVHCYHGMFGIAWGKRTGETARKLDGTIGRWVGVGHDTWVWETNRPVLELLLDDEDASFASPPTRDLEWDCVDQGGGVWRVTLRSAGSPDDRFSLMTAVYSRFTNIFYNHGYRDDGVRLGGGSERKYDQQGPSPDPTNGLRMSTTECAETPTHNLGAAWGRVDALESTTEQGQKPACLSRHSGWHRQGDGTRGEPAGLPSGCWWIDLSAIHGQQYNSSGNFVARVPLTDPHWGSVHAVKFDNLQIIKGVADVSKLSPAMTQRVQRPPESAFHYGGGILSICPVFQDANGDLVHFTPGPGSDVEITVALGGYGQNVETDKRFINIYGENATFAGNNLESWRLQDAIQFHHVRGPKDGGVAMKPTRGPVVLHMPAWSIVHGNSGIHRCLWDNLETAAFTATQAVTEEFSLGVDGLKVKGGDWTGLFKLRMGRHRRFDDVRFVDHEGPYLRTIASVTTLPGYTTEAPFTDLTVPRAGCIIEDSGGGGRADVRIVGELTVGGERLPAPGVISEFPYHVGGLPQADQPQKSEPLQFAWDLAHFREWAVDGSNRVINDATPYQPLAGGGSSGLTIAAGVATSDGTANLFRAGRGDESMASAAKDDIMLAAWFKVAGPSRDGGLVTYSGDSLKLWLRFDSVSGTRITLGIRSAIGGTPEITIASIDLARWVFDDEWHYVQGIVSWTTGAAVIVLDGHVIGYLRKFEELPPRSGTKKARITNVITNLAGSLKGCRVTRATPFIPTRDTIGLWRFRGNLNDAASLYRDHAGNSICHLTETHPISYIAGPFGAGIGYSRHPQSGAKVEWAATPKPRFAPSSPKSKPLPLYTPASSLVFEGSLKDAQGGADYTIKAGSISYTADGGAVFGTDAKGGITYIAKTIAPLTHHLGVILDLEFVDTPRSELLFRVENDIGYGEVSIEKKFVTETEWQIAIEVYAGSNKTTRTDNVYDVLANARNKGRKKLKIAFEDNTFPRVWYDVGSGWIETGYTQKETQRTVDRVAKSATVEWGGRAWTGKKGFTGTMYRADVYYDDISEWSPVLAATPKDRAREHIIPALLPGSDDRVPIVSVESLSIGAWVKFAGDDARQTIAEYRQDNGDVMAVEVSAKGALMLTASLNAQVKTVTTTVPSDGGWHRVVGSLDRNDDKLKLWIDGARVDNDTVIQKEVFAGGSSTFSVGRGSGTSPHKGELAEVMLTTQAGPF